MYFLLMTSQYLLQFLINFIKLYAYIGMSYFLGTNIMLIAFNLFENRYVKRDLQQWLHRILLKILSNKLFINLHFEKIDHLNLDPLIAFIL